MNEKKKKEKQLERGKTDGTAKMKNKAQQTASN